MIARIVGAFLLALLVSFHVVQGNSLERFLLSAAASSQESDLDSIKPSLISVDDSQGAKNDSSIKPFCMSGYGGPRTALHIKGGFVEEESGLASSRLNPGILWIHNDNYDLKRVYAISLKGANAGQVVAIVDLETLPGVNKYSDFEDLSVGR